MNAALAPQATARMASSTAELNQAPVSVTQPMTPNRTARTANATAAQRTRDRPGRWKLNGLSIAAGLRRARPDAEVLRVPVGDGGPGTLEALLAAGFERVPVAATGPTGEPVAAAIAVDGARAFVELAEASGLARLPGGRLAPREANP